MFRLPHNPVEPPVPAHVHWTRRLPPCLSFHRSLISKHSGVLDANIAYRFLATYPSPNKGYTALSECVVSVAEVYLTRMVAWDTFEASNQLLIRAVDSACASPWCCHLPNCVQEWRVQHGLVGLLDQPHPKVELHGWAAAVLPAAPTASSCCACAPHLAPRL